MYITYHIFFGQHILDADFIYYIIIGRRNIDTAFIKYYIDNRYSIDKCYVHIGYIGIGIMVIFIGTRTNITVCHQIDPILRDASLRNPRRCRRASRRRRR